MVVVEVAVVGAVAVVAAAEVVAAVGAVVLAVVAAVVAGVVELFSGEVLVVASASSSSVHTSPSRPSIFVNDPPWHHRLGHPSLPRLRGMHSRLLISGLPRSLPPLPPSPAPPCVPCVEGRQRAAPHSSSFPPTTAPLQTLHMDVRGTAPVKGQGRERYFLLVVDDYSRYTTVFPLHCKSDVPAVLIRWIRAVRLQLRERFRTDLPVLRLHSDRGGEFSSDWPLAIVQIPPWTSSPLAPFPAFSLALSLMRLAGSFTTPPRTVSSPLRTSPLTSRFPFTDSSPTALLPPPPPPLFLAPGPPPVDPLPPPGPAPSGVSQVDPLPLAEPVEVTGDSGAAGGGARGAESGGAEPERAEPGGAEPARAEPGGAEPAMAEPGGAEPKRAEPGGAELERAELGGAAFGGVAPRGTTSPLQEPLSPQQLRKWYSSRCRLRSDAAGASGTGAGDAGAGGTGGAGPSGSGGAGAGNAGVGGPRVGDAGAGGAGGAGARDTGVRATRAGGTGAGIAGAGGTRADTTRAGGARAGGPGTGGPVQQRPFFEPPPQLSELPPESVLRQVLSLPSSTALPSGSPLPVPSR
ncbi:unnamed protein product [Closterium sp. Yama58-4]|nr:unnamed protein product [Closterium sp. Yama58-4]